jgi:hypothetical protein
MYIDSRCESMTPKETVQTAFETAITPALEQEGFSYSRSQFAYRRKLSEFVQHISITLSHHNRQESIQFWSAFNVSSPRYDRWLADQGRQKFDGYIGGCMDWNIPGWRESGDHSTSFDFSDPASRPSVLGEWWRRCSAAGLPYLTSLCSWRGAAEDLIRVGWHHDRAADFFLIGGLKESAIAALEAGLGRLKNEEVPLSPNAHPTVVWKRKREAEDRQKRRLAFLQRISDLRNSEPGGAANGGPATRLGNSRVTDGTPSVT